MRAGVAAGHPATTEVGAGILAEGGTAADAVVAMGLASCVAETVMSGLLSGCHAIVYDGSRVSNVDGFAAPPVGRRRSPRCVGALRRRDRRLLDRPGGLCSSRASGNAGRALPAAGPPALEAARRAGARPRPSRCPTPGDAQALARDARRRPHARARRRDLRSRGAVAASRRPPRAARPRDRARGAVRGGLAECLSWFALGGAARGGRRGLHRDDLQATRPTGWSPSSRTSTGGESPRAGGFPACRSSCPEFPASPACPKQSESSRWSKRSTRPRPRASTRPTWWPSTAMAAPASSPTRSASAPEPGCPASICS